MIFHSLHTTSKWRGAVQIAPAYQTIRQQCGVYLWGWPAPSRQLLHEHADRHYQFSLALSHGRLWLGPQTERAAHAGENALSHSRLDEPLSLSAVWPAWLGQEQDYRVTPPGRWRGACNRPEQFGLRGAYQDRSAVLPAKYLFPAMTRGRQGSLVAEVLALVKARK